MTNRDDKAMNREQVAAHATAAGRAHRVAAEYGHLRGDPKGALQQIWGEIHSALDIEMFTDQTADGRLARTLLTGLLAKAEFGLEA